MMLAEAFIGVTHTHPHPHPHTHTFSSITHTHTHPTLTTFHTPIVKELQGRN